MSKLPQGGFLRENGAWLALASLFFGGFLVREYQDHREFERKQLLAIHQEVRRRVRSDHEPEAIEQALGENTRLVEDDS
ncbi:MAG: hypothetical protein Q8P67_25205 [archaeon]|nr:hypothetical protein [archaeon]